MDRLLAEGAAGAYDLSVVDSDGNTALHIAVKAKNPTVVDFLLHHGALVAATNSDGHNFVDLAFSSNPPPLVLPAQTFESAHPYSDNMRVYTPVDIPGAVAYRITFDQQTSTEHGCDYIRFYKDGTHSAYWGVDKYTGSGDYPGTSGNPPLLIRASSFVFHFYSDGSNTDWGYKFTVTPLATMPPPDPNQTFSTGMAVRIKRVPVQVFHQLQSGFGGSNDTMERMMGSIHTISGAHSNRFEVGGYHWNPAMLEDPTSQGTVSASTTVRPLKSIPTGPESDAIRAIINTFLNGAPVSFDWEWLALRKRAFEMGLFPTSMDEIVNRYIGLEEVKRKTIALIEMVLQDKALPVARRQTSRRAYNFMLMGKPGTGKSQVGELLAKLLRELELRPDDSKYVKITGTNLALMKDDDFDQLLKDVTPGILFVDEIHQLDPMGGGSGRARTNILMNMAEDKRTEFSLFGTGYRKKIEETFFSSDPGMKSRFPYIWEFKDYNESELRTIFLKMVAQDNWKLAPIDNSPIDVATVLARRLALQSEDPTFANARAVRNAYENSLMASSVRKKRLGILATSEEAYTLTVADVGW